MQIDPSRRGHLPPLDASTRRGYANGMSGWQIKFPANRPLATPAAVDGAIFLGGGFGSYEFYSLDALTGDLLWQYQTSDDGPTAAVVADGFVVFNTESCELEVLTVGGSPVWKRWLGDPLMSMPAVGAGRVFMAYPDSRGDHQHYLACFSLKSGELFWKQPITGEIITAPVLAEACVYLTTLDGTVYSFAQDDGTLNWRDSRLATSSPTVHEGKCFYSQRQAVAGESGPEQTEHCARQSTMRGSTSTPYRQTSRKADYLDYGKRAARSFHFAAEAAADAGVGFSSFKGSSKMYQAQENIGHGHVYGVWSYQGSKPFVSGRKVYSAAGDTVCAFDMDSEQVDWQFALPRSDNAELLDSCATPPCLVNNKLYVGTRAGQVLCLEMQTGQELWRVSLGEPVLFQPVVAHGRLYVPTAAGTLHCIETGDAHDEGWLMWGATPQHNGL